MKPTHGEVLGDNQGENTRSHPDCRAIHGTLTRRGGAHRSSRLDVLQRDAAERIGILFETYVN